MKYDTFRIFRLQAQHLVQMPGNGFSILKFLSTQALFRFWDDAGSSQKMFNKGGFSGLTVSGKGIRILPDHLKVCLSGYSLIANGSDENACN